MKKGILVLSIISAMCMQLNAQYWTVRLAGGYAWPGFQNSETLKTPVIDPANPKIDGLVDMANRSNFPDTMKSVQPVHGSYGKGMNFTLGVGYMFNPYIGVDLGVSYLKSATTSSQETHEVILNAGGFLTYTGYTLQADISTSATGLSLMPSLVVTGAKPGWKVYPYARLGISLPVFGSNVTKLHIHVQDEFFDQPGLPALLNSDPYYLGKNTDVTIKTEGTVSLGVNGAIGVAYRPLPYLNVFAEINGQYLVTRAKSATVTQWDADGVSKIGNDPTTDRSVYRTKFNFVDKLDQNSNNKEYNAKASDDKPKDDLRPYGPFSNLGFNVGVTFMLSKQTLKKQKDEAKN